MTKFNERTITTKKAMMEEILRIRKNGYATDLAEEFDGCNCVGSAIRDHAGYPIAMLWATGTSFNITETKFPTIGKAVAATAMAISRKFGFQPLEK